MTSELTVTSINGIDHLIIPGGNTANRPAISNGTFYFNTDLQTIELVSNNSWYTLKIVDGPGSNLDADTLDGVQGANYARTDTDETFNGNVTIDQTASGNAVLILDTDTGQHNSVSGRRNGDQRWTMSFGDSASEAGSDAGSDFRLYRYSDAGSVLGTAVLINRNTGNVVFESPSITAGGNTVWHAGNDGSGSGLDADTVDGIHAADLGGVAAPTSFTTLPVGFAIAMRNDGGSVSNNGTTAGSNLHVFVSELLGAPPGTWKNISGKTVSGGGVGYGLFVRTA
jgi:hypothetical protein